MKSIFDTVSKDCSRIITQTYSTSFSMATKMLSNSIRQDIYNIYGFVRLADEIVDSFHDYDKEALFVQFEADLEAALINKISLNPILNSFQETYHNVFVLTKKWSMHLWIQCVKTYTKRSITLKKSIKIIFTARLMWLV